MVLPMVENSRSDSPGQFQFFRFSPVQFTPSIPTSMLVVATILLIDLLYKSRPMYKQYAFSTRDDPGDKCVSKSSITVTYRNKVDYRYMCYVLQYVNICNSLKTHFISKNGMFST